MLIQTNPFTWYFQDPDKQDLKISYRRVDSVFAVSRQIQLTDRSCVVETISTHPSLVEAEAASDCLQPHR